jgi:phage-related protein
MIDYKILITGERFEVRAIRRLQHDESLLKQYLGSLDLSDRKKFLRAIRKLAEYGTPRSSEKHRKLQGHDNLYELKIKRHRLLFFFAGERIAVFTHAFAKHSDKTPQSELDRAVNLRTEYYETFGTPDA